GYIGPAEPAGNGYSARAAAALPIARGHDHQVAHVGLAVSADNESGTGLEERLGDQELPLPRQQCDARRGAGVADRDAHLRLAATVRSATASAVSARARGSVTAWISGLIPAPLRTPPPPR